MGLKMHSMPPSEELIELARRRLDQRASAQEAYTRYRVLAKQFRAESEFDSHGFRQALLEIEGPDGILPPAPPTTRGRLGQWIIRLQARSLWWLTRALRLEGRALRSAYATLRHESERLTQVEDTLAQQLAGIRLRLERIERQLNLPGKEKVEP